MLTEELIAEPHLNVRGKLIRRQDADYEQARKVHNGMIDKYPDMIVQCVDVADVIAAVNFARENDVLVAVRSGGHSGGGFGMCDKGLVIDLSHMKGIRVDPVERTALVEAGCTLGDVDHATHAFGLALPSGIVSTTGVGGITLGGGLGHLTRHCGLSIDNMLEADVVLADGSFVKASATQNPDLFWGLRGGGGNFGVVTSFLFRLHPISTVYGGPMLWPMSEARAVMQWYRTFIQKAPDYINGFFAFLSVPPGPPFPEQLWGQTMCGVVWCYTGAPEQVEKTFEPIRSFRPPALDLVGPLPLPALQSMFDGLYPPGLQWYWKADFVNELSDEAIDIHLKFGHELPTPLSTMHLYPINGAAARVGAQSTAWNYRHSTWSMVIAGVDADPANRQRITDWAKAYWNALHPYSAGGAYVNFMMEEGQERIKATYGINYEHLVTVKNKYDPDNLFRVNQNIRPTKNGHVFT
ncbi:oxidoreductase [Hymenobacter qilianensis]|uniref:FAD-binding oxidoreductase n=2 Tax=Hymenobacter qilianensis TaxID=1385715 RepID=A0A7H0GZK6_9BACT|nr:FAD-binding oxidoreductase [Hymenobacter qilianensis]QNP53722.1 FAD-binding oxidoreductase [Hymenobacter qilianensis]GGF53537.1 oxidoreductase [Hymenobacter qilianensis]